MEELKRQLDIERKDRQRWQGRLQALERRVIFCCINYPVHKYQFVIGVYTPGVATVKVRK